MAETDVISPEEAVTFADKHLQSKFDEFRKIINNCSPQQQWLVIYQLLRDRMGEKPDQAAAICDANGETYIYLTPVEEQLALGTDTASERDIVNDEPVIDLSDALRALFNVGEADTASAWDAVERIEQLRQIGR